MITITIHDQVNASVDGLTQKQRKVIRDKTAIMEPGAWMRADVKTGNSDGKVSHFDEETGLTFIYMLDKILDVMEDDLGIDIDSEVLLDDESEYIDLDVSLIDENFLKDETGFTLRPHQIEGINSVITNRCGVLEHATSAGKSGQILGISKAFDPYMGSLVIVPSESLVLQTFEYYENSNLNAIALTKKIPPKKRKEVFEQYDHIIITTKLLLNCLEYVDGKRYALMGDEIHRMGDVFSNALRFELRNCPVRVGLTGTVPDDKLKKEKLFCHMNGGILDIVTPKELIDKKFAANVNINMISTSHTSMEDLSYNSPRWDWDTEETYLGTNIHRIEAIANHIKSSYDDRNTLVLCHPQMGLRLCKHFNGRMIVDETHTDQRKEWLDEFDDNERGVLLCASIGTVGTGTSVKAIHRLILIDIGKNKTYIKQGIGRAMRLSDNNDVEIIDISAKTKYSDRHRKDRIKIYKKDDYPFTEEDHEIYVSDEMS